MIYLIEIYPALQQKILPPVKLSDCEIRPKTEAWWWVASMQTKCTWVVVFDLCAILHLGGGLFKGKLGWAKMAKY